MKPVIPWPCSARLAFALAASLSLAAACSTDPGAGPSTGGGGAGSGGQSGSGGPSVGGAGGSSTGAGAAGVGGGQGGSSVASSGGASGGSSAGAGARGGSSAGGAGTGGASAGGGGGTSSGGGGGGATGAGGLAGSSGATGGANAAGTGGGGTGAAGSAGSIGGGSGAYDPCPAAPTDCKIMPFGDSITDGYLAQRGGYRIPLFQRAHQEGKHLTFVGSAVNGPATVDGVPFPQHHEGHSAYTIDDEPLPLPAHKGIAPFVATSIPAYHPDIVLLMIGTNDVDNSIDLPNVPTRLGALIDSIIAQDAHILTVVAQITPTMQDPLNVRIQAYNAAIPAVVKARTDAGKHVALVDMYDAFVSDPSYRTTLMYDRLHPNIAGFQKMADTWNTVIHDLIH